MENKGFWWLKSSRSDSQLGRSIETNDNATSPQIEEISSSLAEFIEKEQENEDDIESIIEKMNRLAAQSPLGAYQSDQERSVEDIMKEAERIYLESSKSFEQLSIHSKTSQNITDLHSLTSDASTPTPKSLSPLPLDSNSENNKRMSKSSESDSYTDDFYEYENRSDEKSKSSKEFEENDEKSTKIVPRNFENNEKTKGTMEQQKIVDKTMEKSNNLLSNKNEMLPGKTKADLTAKTNENARETNENVAITKRNENDILDTTNNDSVKKINENVNKINENLKKINENAKKTNESVKTNENVKTIEKVTSSPEKTSEKVSSDKSSTPESVKIVKSSSMSNFGNKKTKINMPSLHSFDQFYNNEENSSVLEQKKVIKQLSVDMENIHEEMDKKEGIIKLLIEDNKKLKENIKDLEVKLHETTNLLNQTQTIMRTENLKSPELNLELERAMEEIKDTKEINTGLQLQLDKITKSHQTLKNSYDDILNSNRNLERRLTDTETLLNKYKTEVINVQKHRDKLIDSEESLNKLLEIEKMQVKGLKNQTEKDAKCILDLNRQIKEMERIIARKHPDSVSALIVASKNDPIDGNLSARKVLEDRIKNLEQEALMRDSQSSKVFLDVQEKFNQMKLKYESHIEDLELHVSDLKEQLKHKKDSYDVYTQTFFDQKIPEKETKTKSVQTAEKSVPQRIPSAKKPEKSAEKEETHLLATIRGLQADLSNKEKVIVKLQKEVDELRKTNRRLQKEREGSLKCLSDKKDLKTAPEKNLGSFTDDERKLVDELKALKTERDKMKVQLMRIEEDYQQLKTKRLQDLTALQEAHEREISTYLTNITPLREQMEVQQVTISTLQSQLSTTKEQLAIITVERDHLNNRINCGANLLNFTPGVNDNEDSDSAILRKKIAYLEQKHQEREHRLHAIVHGLAQKNVTNRSCEQCAQRQQQLIGYKAELDQLLVTLRCLQ